MAAIPATARPTPIPAFLRGQALVDPKTGAMSQLGQQQQERLRNYVQGAGRIIPCSASAVGNLITLQPNEAAPSIEGYIFGDCYAFWAPATSNGAVTATLVPKTGTLATLKVYLGDAATQAGAGDVVASAFYLAFYMPILDGNAGGLVLLGNRVAAAVVTAVGSFTCANDPDTVVAASAVTAASRLCLTPTNVDAGALQAGPRHLYLSARSAGVSFTLTTASGVAAGGTETFEYALIG